MRDQGTFHRYPYVNVAYVHAPRSPLSDPASMYPSFCMGNKYYRPDYINIDRFPLLICSWYYLVAQRLGAARAPRGRRPEILPGEVDLEHSWGLRPARVSCTQFLVP